MNLTGMKFEVLVPTHHKTKDECFSLVEKLNISSNCIIANQCEFKDNFSNSNITVLFTNNIGVSNNRNNLLANASGDICICIDDDCPLVDNYEEIIENTFKKYPDAEFILFNGVVTHEHNRLIHNKKTKKVRKFKDVSYAGGPGLVFKREAIKKYNLSYNTKVGYPNKIQIGEDSLFIKSIVDSKAKFVRSSDVLFIIQDDIDNSIYFKGVTEEFLISKGCIDKIVHPYLFWLLKYRYAIKLKNWRNNQLSFFEILKLLVKGSKNAKSVIN